MTTPLLKIQLRRDEDVVLARQRAREIAAHLGLDAHDQARLATAVSEIARNAVQYAGTGWVQFEMDGGEQPSLLVRVWDAGPGIPHLDDVLAGRYQSTTGLGIGLTGAIRLTDRFTIEAPAGLGTTVTLGKVLPPAARRGDRPSVAQLTQALVSSRGQDAMAELEHRNRELVGALATLAERQAETDRLNAELAETNRGVLALYAELDDRAAELGRASQLKSAFLSGISHELRTPLNAILNMTRILLSRMDGELTDEQEIQVGLIQRAAASLTELVADLLDLARIEAGKTEVRPVSFTVGDIFGTLRGMFRPLLTSDEVTLAFEQPGYEVTIHTDEGKLSQILRNLISNAMKFTERGEIRVSAALAADDVVVFAVADSGIGILPEDQTRIFEEFAQVDNALQKRAKGTGLGLPLSRKLTSLLGGTLEVESALGVGSRFELRLPRIYREPRLPPALGVPAEAAATEEREHV
jgi:signal transduction histidine kinase